MQQVRESSARAEPSLDVSVMIVSFNTATLTVAAAQSVFEQRGELAVEVLVVDNNSHDDTVARLATECPEARVFAETENHGFGVGNHVAAREARGRYLLMLNPDAVLLDGALEAIHDFAQRKPGGGLWGGWTYEQDGRVNPSFAWGRATLWSTTCRTLGFVGLFPKSPFLNPEGVATWSPEAEREVDFISGCFLLIERSLWDQLGGFDRDFFMYAEDADLGLRTQLAGFRPSITPSAKVIHVGGESEPDQGGKLVRIYTAKVLLSMKHDSAPIAFLMRWSLLLQVITRCIGFGLLALLGKARAKISFRSWSTLLAHRSDWMRGRFADFARGLR